MSALSPFSIIALFGVSLVAGFAGAGAWIIVAALHSMSRKRHLTAAYLSVKYVLQDSRPSRSGCLIGAHGVLRGRLGSADLH